MTFFQFSLYTPKNGTHNQIRRQTNNLSRVLRYCTAKCKMMTWLTLTDEWQIRTYVMWMYVLVRVASPFPTPHSREAIDVAKPISWGLKKEVQASRQPLRFDSSLFTLWLLAGFLCCVPGAESPFPVEFEFGFFFFFLPSLAFIFCSFVCSIFQNSLALMKF